MNTPTFQNSVPHYSSSSSVVRTDPENTGDSDSSPAIESHATIDPEALIRELSKLALGHEDHTENYRWIQYVHNGPDDDGFNRDVCLKDDDSDDGHEYDYDTESSDFKWHLNTFCLKKAVLEPYDIQQAENPPPSLSFESNIDDILDYYVDHCLDSSKPKSGCDA